MCDFDFKNSRNLFPCLIAEKNRKTIYFDNAATTHKPRVVIDKISDFYGSSNSNIHRSAHGMGASATEQYESVRSVVQDFLSAESAEEIVFTSGATDSINLVAHSFGKNFISAGDVILVSPIEHHSNLIPWQMLAKEKNAVIQEIPINQDLTVNLKKLKSLLNSSVKLLPINHVSNVTGGVQNIKDVVGQAKLFNIPVFVDGAQAAAHINIDVVDLGCDFYCFSGHKVFGPTGTGVLFIKHDYLERLAPYRTGGQMVSKVSFDSSEWGAPPLKFEAGTPNIAGVIGLGEAIKFITTIGILNISKYEMELESYFYEGLKKVPNLSLYAGHKRAAPIFSFNVKGAHHYDIATLLSENNIFVRSGHLCNQTLMNYLGIEGCVRASLSFYNTQKEIDLFIDALKLVFKFLKI